MVRIAHEFQFEHQLMCGKKEIHAGAGPCVAWSELFGPDVSDPWMEKRMQQVLNVVLRFKGQTNVAFAPLCQWVHRSAKVLNENQQKFFDVSRLSWVADCWPNNRWKNFFGRHSTRQDSSASIIAKPVFF